MPNGPETGGRPSRPRHGSRGLVILLTIVAALARQHGFAEQPDLSWRGRIAGQVYQQDEGRSVGVAGVTIRLADGRATVTDANGNFAFEKVGKGARRIEALPPALNAFFVTP